MDNVNIQEVSNETSTMGVSEEGTKKRFTFKKAIKYVVIAVAILIIYEVFFAASGADKAISTVQNSCFMDDYGNATSETFGNYFVDGNGEDGEYDEPITNVQWSAELNDTGTNYIVTLTYTVPSNGVNAEEDNSNYTQANNYTTIKWFVDDDNIECIYLAKNYFNATGFDLSGSDAQDRLALKLDSGSY